MKLRALAFAAGLAMSGAASAVDLGDFDAPRSWSSGFTVTDFGGFIHNHTFTITENLYAGSGVANIPLSWQYGEFTVEFTNITGLSATIYNSNNEVHESFTPVTAGYLTLPASTYFAVGDYTLTITGNATGSGTPAGMYTIAAVTAPVPEPETWAMLLVGMGLVGLRVRQKAKASREAALA